MAKNSVYKTNNGRKEVLNYYDQILAQWPQNCKQQYVKTRYGFTFVIECGESTSPPLILLHGAGSNSAMWTADIKKFSGKYKVFAIDIIGECGKSTENRPDFKSSHYSNWLLDVLRALKIENAIFVGCSLGGFIATKFTINHSEKVNQLVLIASSGYTPIKPSLLFWIIITSISGKRGFNKMNKIVYGELELDLQTIEFTKLVQQHFIPRTNNIPIFSDTELQKIEKPVFFIGGDNDCFFDSQKTVERLKNTVENFNYEILQNTGHVITSSANRILTFLKSNKNGKD